MIEIKNKRMMLYPEDRLIGAEGDINTGEKKFVLKKVQGGCDLSDFVAFIKIEPHNNFEAYDQMLTKEISGENLILTWKLSDANLRAAGEISVQVALASPDYYDPSDLDQLDENDFVVPIMIDGVSAPVWQSYKETFIVDESISENDIYRYEPKNVIVTAMATAIDAVEKATTAAQSCSLSANECQYLNTQSIELKEDCEQSALKAEEYYNLANEALSGANELVSRIDGLDEMVDEAQSCATVASSAQMDCETYFNDIVQLNSEALTFKEGAEQARDEAVATAQKTNRNTSYRLIFSKTLEEGESDISAFEITQDIEGNPVNLCDFAAYLSVPMHEAASSTYLRTSIKTDLSQASYTSLTLFSGISRTEDISLRIEGKLKGRWCSTVIRGPVNAQTIETFKVYKTVHSPNRNIDGMPLKAIKIQTHSENEVKFPVGTTIEIWGRDAYVSEEGA